MVPIQPTRLSRNAVFLGRLALVLTIAMMMASCRTAGDFGRQRPSYFYDHLIPSTRVAISNLSGVKASAYPLTDAEQQLRAHSMAIIENEGSSLRRRTDQLGVDLGIHDGTYQRKRRVAHSAGTADLDRERYPRHPDILLNAITDDLQELQKLSVASATVYQTDHQRLQALRSGGDVPADDIKDTTGRVSENRRIVKNTILALHNRVDDYEVELNRSMLVYPGDHREKVSNAIGRLTDRTRNFERAIRELSNQKGIKHDPGLLG